MSVPGDASDRALVAPPSTKRISSLGLVVSDIVAAEAFFAAAFDCVTLERSPGDAAFAQLVGLPGASARRTRMRLGEQEIVLVCFDPPGRPYPRHSTSTDLWFQHFAIIVSDMAAAYARLQAAARFHAITEGGPIRLPPASGGVEAFKFRDDDGHPLELLAFPQDSGPEVWRRKRGDGLFLGIDHSAISVGSTATSVQFLRSCFGLAETAQTENIGPEQARMDDVPDARVTVTGLAPAHVPPHVELLGYHVGTRRPIESRTRADDIAATFFVLETEALDAVVEALVAQGAPFISPGVVTLADGRRAATVLDPDGHRFIVEGP